MCCALKYIHFSCINNDVHLNIVLNSKKLEQATFAITENAYTNQIKSIEHNTVH